jgi:hypothetical protein
MNRVSTDRLACGVALALFTVVASLTAQDVTPPLARVINRELKVEFPLHPCAVASIVRFIARDVNIPAGIEYLPEECGWDRPHTPDRAIEPLLLRAQTVEQVMNQLVTADPRYRWAMSDGVLVIRPVTAWADREHFLNQRAGRFGFDEQNMHGALHYLMLAFGQRSHADALIPGRTAQGEQKFTVQPPTTSLIGALDAVVRAHGAMQWEISYCRPEVRIVNATLWLWTNDGSGIGAPFYAIDGTGRRVSGCAPASRRSNR